MRLTTSARNQMLTCFRQAGRWIVAIAVFALVGLTGCDTGTSPTATEDDPPEVEFAKQALTTTEGDSPADISVAYRNPDGAPVTVDVLYGNAASTTSPADLNLPGGEEPGFVVRTFTFSGEPDDTLRTIELDITDDESGEERELAFFALQNLSTTGAASLGENKEFQLEIGFPTLAEVRANNGADDLVSFQGTVTRSRGNFTYLQDESSTGITIRQTSGDFQSAVASNEIKPGTRLQITGTLEFFAGLLQINQEGLDRAINLGDGSVPDPKTVTLDELEGAGGEAYEGELVRIEDLTFADAGGTFSAEENYDVSDGEGSLVARVPESSDTVWPGETIPSSPVTFVGVVGQFHGFDFVDEPDSGYQLLLIEESDLR